MEINTVTLTGRLVKDPESKKVKDTDLCSFRMASNRVFGKDKNEKNLFIDVDVWGGQAAPCGKYLSKGSKVAITGTLCQDTWEGEGGKKNSKIFIEANNVMFLDAKPESEKTDAPPAAKSEKPVAAKTPAKKPQDDEEIPF